MGSAIQDDLFGQLNTSLVKVGVDEVGRGCLAGPVVACACFASTDCKLPKVYDSKAISASDREALFLELTHLDNFHYAFGVVDSDQIDKINILQATFLAMKKAISKLPQTFDEVLVDGSMCIPGLNIPQQAIVKGDAKEPLIGAASILAKVFRDQLMEIYTRMYPDYGFNMHKGYGTPFHLEKLRELGPSSIHRKSFAPLSKKLDNQELYLPLEDFFI
jgi:ribonuclease HII